MNADDVHPQRDPDDRARVAPAPEGEAAGAPEAAAGFALDSGATPPAAPHPAKGPRNQPPKEHQFKPGRSGNPRGRPKRAKGLRTIVREVMEQKVAVRTNGRRTTVTAAQAALNKALATALGSGSVRDVTALFQLAERYGLAAEEAGAAGAAPFTPADEADIADFLRRVRQGRVLVLEDPPPAAADAGEPCTDLPAAVPAARPITPDEETGS